MKNRWTQWRVDVWPMVFCLICAAALLMVCSMNSWLYPVNPWVDVNIVATVGRGMLHGQVPYRDLFDHKGPLAFLVFGLGTELFPGRYYAFYLFEIIGVAGALFFGWKTIRLYRPGLSVAWMAPLCAVLLLSGAFVCGGSAEEMLLLPLAWSIYDLLRCWRSGRPLAASELVRNGILAGCVLWTKFNLLGVHFIWMAAMALDSLVKEKKLGPPVRMCLWFLGGMALASLPWLIYFGLNGALDNLVQNYFIDNIFGYDLATGGGRFRAINLAKGLLYVVRRDSVYAALLAVAGIAVLLLPLKKMALREKAALVAMAVMVVALTYGTGVINDYYAVTLAIFLPFSLLVLEWIPDRGIRLQGPLRVAMSVATLAICVCMAWRLNVHANDVGVPHEDTPQGQIAEIIREDQRQEITLLQYQLMDIGCYLASGAKPADRWFSFVNIRRGECLEAIQALVDEGVSDYVVTGARTEAEIEELDRYQKVLQFSSNYGMREDECMFYCLYRRTEED